MAQNNDLLGNDLKFLIDPSATGFDKFRDEWEVDVTNGKAVLHFDKTELIVEQGDFYVCFSSEALGQGQYYITVTAHIPDTDFDDNSREEVWQAPLINIQKPKK